MSKSTQNKQVDQEKIGCDTMSSAGLFGIEIYGVQQFSPSISSGF